MTINFIVSQQGTFTGYWVANLYDPTALSTVLQTINIPMPFSGSQTASFTNVANQAYIVRQYLSNTTDYHDGTQLGADVQIQAGVTTSSVIRDDLWLTAGTTSGMTVGSTTYNDISLAGWDFSISMPGLADLQPGVDYNILSGGGFELINGNTFQNGERYVIHFQPNITSGSGGGGGSTFTNASGKLFSGISVLTADTTLAPSDMGKIIMISGTNTSIKVTLPEVSTVPDDVMTCLMSNAGNHIMATIYASAGFLWQKRLSANLYMAQGEELWIFKHGSNWYVANSDGNFKTVGAIFDCYQSDQINAIPLNGGLLSRALYPRLWEYVQNQLDPTLLISDGTWALFNTISGPITQKVYPNVGKFSTGNGSTTFRVPLIMKTIDSSNNIISSGFTRGIGSPQAPFTSETGDTAIGRNEMDAVGNFFANLYISTDKTSTSQNGSGKITCGNDAAEPIPLNLQNIPFAGSSYNGSTYPLNGETRPGNIGIYKMMLY